MSQTLPTRDAFPSVFQIESLGLGHIPGMLLYGPLVALQCFFLEDSWCHIPDSLRMSSPPPRFAYSSAVLFLLNAYMSTLLPVGIWPAIICVNVTVSMPERIPPPLACSRFHCGQPCSTQSLPSLSSGSPVARSTYCCASVTDLTLLSPCLSTGLRWRVRCRAYSQAGAVTAHGAGDPSSAS